MDLGSGVLNVVTNVLTPVGAFLGATVGAMFDSNVHRLPCHQVANQWLNQHNSPTHGYPNQTNFQPRCMHCQKVPNEANPSRLHQSAPTQITNYVSGQRPRSHSETRIRSPQAEVSELKNQIEILKQELEKFRKKST